MKKTFSLVAIAFITAACSGPTGNSLDNNVTGASSLAPSGSKSSTLSIDSRYSCGHPAIVSVITDTKGRTVNIHFKAESDPQNYQIEILRNLTNTVVIDNNGKPVVTTVDGSISYVTFTGLDDGNYWARVRSKACNEFGTPTVQTPEATFTVDTDSPIPVYCFWRW